MNEGTLFFAKVFPQTHEKVRCVRRKIPKVWESYWEQVSKKGKLRRNWVPRMLLDQTHTHETCSINKPFKAITATTSYQYNLALMQLTINYPFLLKDFPVGRHKTTASISSSGHGPRCIIQKDSITPSSLLAEYEGRKAKIQFPDNNVRIVFLRVF